MAVYAQSEEVSSLSFSVVRQYTALVEGVARRVKSEHPKWYSYPLTDMINEGWIGFMDAYSRRNSNAKTFNGYARIRVRGAIMDHARTLDVLGRAARENIKKYQEAYHRLAQDYGRRPTRIELMDELGFTYDIFRNTELSPPFQLLSLDEILKPDGFIVDTTTEDAAALIDDRVEDPMRNLIIERMMELVEELPEQHRRVVIMYYFDNLYLKEIGQRLDVGESRTCQILAQAHDRLKQRMGDVNIE